MRVAHLSLVVICLIPQLVLGGIVSDLEANGLTVLADLIVKNDLAKTLESVEPATIFAPTNEALNSLDISDPYQDNDLQVCDRAPSQPRCLKVVDYLLYHVVPKSAIFSTDLKSDNKVDTAHQTPLRVNAYPSGVTANGVRVVKPDVSVGSGSVAHVVEFGLPALETFMNIPFQLSQYGSGRVFMEGGFDKFLELVHYSPEIYDYLKTTDAVTVFAPVEKAFDNIPIQVLDALKAPENADKLASILKKHIVPQTLFANGITPNTAYQTLDSDVTLSVTSAAILSIKNSLGQEAGILHSRRFNIPATNGVIHSIDTVFL